MKRTSFCYLREWPGKDHKTDDTRAKIRMKCKVIWEEFQAKNYILKGLRKRICLEKH